MASRRPTKHAKQEALFTKAGTARRRRPRTYQRGKRPGRPPKVGARLRHAPRAALARRNPVHVTWRMAAGLPNLRSPEAMGVIRAAFRRGKDRFGFRLVHYSVQKNHVHMLCEAEDATSLARGLQGLAVRAARGLNRRWGRKGKVLGDRYHSRILESPSAARWAIGYVLCNARRHNAQLMVPTRYPRRWLDEACSSAAYFPGWAGVRRHREPDARSEVVTPRTFFLRRGWLKVGKIPTDHVPGPRAG